MSKRPHEYLAERKTTVKSKDWASEEANKIVLWWGNFFNWGRTPNRYGDHIPPEQQHRLERMIATRLRRAFAKGKRDRVNEY